MMTHGVNLSWRDWKDFCLLAMSIERAGTPLLMRMVGKRGTNASRKICVTCVTGSRYSSLSG